ncbi:MAG: DUF1599 domain-containing protein [Bacteroidetes bacterium]|nr:MAG: DUF1599 domain-containing protein [Bacteroidota bacterium]
MNSKTPEQFNQAIAQCREVFVKKHHDYGSAWRILRQRSLTDQIFIKAKRLKSIEEKGKQMVDEAIENEYIGIVNYCIMALIQMERGPNENESHLPAEVVESLYDAEVEKTRDLMFNKNHDYGEAWRDMRVSTFTDLILMKLLRTKQIEDLEGKTLISEGIDANFRDMINYSIFALIRISEEHEITHRN